MTLSKGCDAPAGDIATMAPLPRTAGKLRDRSTLKVLVIGSSSGARSGASFGKSYPSEFESILEKAFKGLDVKIVHRGVSGELASMTSERLKTQVAMEEPDLVLWQVGTNDALAHVPVETFAQTVRGTIRWLKEHDVDVVLVGLQYALGIARDEYYAAIRANLHKVATSENVLLVRRFEAMEFLEKAKAGAVGAGQGSEPGEAGSHCMAEHVARAIVTSIFLK